jgi:hypothetical protein
MPQMIKTPSTKNISPFIPASPAFKSSTTSMADTTTFIRLRSQEKNETGNGFTVQSDTTDLHANQLE